MDITTDVKAGYGHQRSALSSPDTRADDRSYIRSRYIYTGNQIASFRDLSVYQTLGFNLIGVYDTLQRVGREEKSAVSIT